MSRPTFKQMMIVGHVREALNELTEYLGCDIYLRIPEKPLFEKWERLEKHYEEFYKLSIPERLEYVRNDKD